MRSIFFCLILMIAAAPARADILYLNKGDEINGDVSAMDAGSVRITAAGKEQSFDRKEVMKIQFVKEYDSGAAEPLKDPEITRLLAAMPDAKDYPNDGYITWLNDINIVVNPDKSWTLSRRGIRVILRERGKSPAAYLSYNYLPAIQDAGIDYAYSVTDSTVSYLSDVSVMEGSPYMDYPAYDKLKLVKYAIPNVQTGSLLAYRSHYSHTDLQTASGLYSGSVYGFLSTVRALKKRFSDFNFYVAWDTTSKRKKNLLPQCRLIP